MVFSSITFLFYFLPIVLAAYYIVPKSIKNIVLLIGSLFFYAWGEPTYVFLMLLSICGNYFCGKYIEEAKQTNAAQSILKTYFAGTVIWNLAILFIFKYLSLFITTLNGAFGTQIGVLKLSLPIGISFYTFQVLSYVIDVYRGNVKAQKSFILFALYVTMFPQLIAGPIVRYTDIEAQLESRTISASKFGKGVERFIIGLAKKVLVANNLGALFTQISAYPTGDRSVFLVWLGAFAFSFQIYFDFSGYSDMAIGLGKMFGFTFPENFRYPYIAKSVTDFWRRWHISLSTWFREYVYIPLGGNRVSVLKHIRNLLIVWLLTGIWHGANWNFLLWGLYYGIFLIFEKYVLGKHLGKVSVIGHIYTILIFVIGWVIFAFTDFGEMRIYISQMFGRGGLPLVNNAFMYHFSNNLLILIIAVLSSTPVLIKIKNKISEKNMIISTLINIILLISSVAFIVYQSYNPFLYFRF